MNESISWVFKCQHSPFIIFTSASMFRNLPRSNFKDYGFHVYVCLAMGQMGCTTCVKSYCMFELEVLKSKYSIVGIKTFLMGFFTNGSKNLL